MAAIYSATSIVFHQTADSVVSRERAAISWRLYEKTYLLSRRDVAVHSRRGFSRNRTAETQTGLVESHDHHFRHGQDDLRHEAVHR